MSNGKQRSMGPFWRSALGSASSRITALKDYAHQGPSIRAAFERGGSRLPEEMRNVHSWKQWAGDRIRRRNDSSKPSSREKEKILMFPGWATRKFLEISDQGDQPFDLVVFCSGYAVSSRQDGQTSRTQKAMLRAAKVFASLPKLPAEMVAKVDMPESLPSLRLSPSTEDLLRSKHLPPTPEEMTEEQEIQELERQLLDFDSETSSLSSNTNPPSPGNPAEPPLTPVSEGALLSNGSSSAHRLHANFHERLLPFWSNALPSRQIHLSLFVGPRSPFPNEDNISEYFDNQPPYPVYSTDVVTSSTGDFEAKLVVPWEELSKHQDGVQLAFGDNQQDYDLWLLAELRPTSQTHLTPNFESGEVPVRSVANIQLAQAPIRLISDIDDTIKLANVLGGARAVFQNVFVKHLEELCIKGMGDWYTKMWSRGVRFHYVSNGPFQLLPVINEFFKVANLPKGSIKMRSYAGRSFLNGLMTDPGARKREGVLSIVTNFSSARFILVGDSGEQDMELYATIAKDYPDQILAIFIRDARRSESPPLDDPIGLYAKSDLARYSNRSSWSGSSSGEFISPTTSQSATQFPGYPRTPGSTGFAIPSEESTQTIKASSSNRPRTMFRSPTADSMQDYFSSAGSSSSQFASRFLKPRSRPLRSPSLPIPRDSSNLEVPVPPLVFSSTTVSESPLPSPSTTPPGAGDLYPRPLNAQQQLQYMPTLEKKRFDLQLRVWKTRLVIPEKIAFRVFREPEECIEADQILDKITFV